MSGTIEKFKRLQDLMAAKDQAPSVYVAEDDGTLVFRIDMVVAPGQIVTATNTSWDAAVWEALGLWNFRTTVG